MLGKTNFCKMFKAIKKCVNCRKWLGIDNFLPREDKPQPQRYAMCLDCMKLLNRRQDYPPLVKRGGGAIRSLSDVIKQLDGNR